MSDEHENCGGQWECLGCGRSVCPRCEPSPAEEELCVDCWWIADPGDAATRNYFDAHPDVVA